MKIRTDYVSNSSSSSYIIALPKDYEFKKFIKEVARACVSKPEDGYGYTKEEISRIKERNMRNLDYCLNTHELLFLGTFCYEYKRCTIKGKKRVAELLKSRDYLKEHCPDMFIVKIVSQGANEIVMDMPLISSGHTISYDDMYTIRQYQMPNKNDKKHYKDVVDAILKRIKISNQWNEANSGLYEITMNTIFNTEALLAECPNNIRLSKWCSNLGHIKKLIKDGNRIFGIDMHQSGEGESSTSIYALAGWDSDAFKYAEVQILDCECC